ncbi:hypothetical protein MCA0457 [Methylococcus capsulatus str. Bath]|uniref:Uncharacterized protein n=1 Tax=Methylococcus capsulatus (strain ATCC 33009 / NCIMB 11132 / Bath) TaxID=243233 RepID=Q60BK9_METCA|nr:hypothetical protein MCA0457 [Methylococcus capsulatus str. Bath]
MHGPGLPARAGRRLQRSGLGRMGRRSGQPHPGAVLPGGTLGRRLQSGAGRERHRAQQPAGRAHLQQRGIRLQGTLHRLRPRLRLLRRHLRRHVRTTVRQTVIPSGTGSKPAVAASAGPSKAGASRDAPVRQRGD